MADCVREMTFEEEAAYYKAEAKAEFDKESGNGDCSKVNSILRRGMRIIRKAREEIDKLEKQLSERGKVVIQLRKQWQDAEMHICTMCGHFNHKTDGNIVYGNKTCGEICGYPFCKEKFTPWIPVSERLPEHGKVVLVCGKRGAIYTAWCNSLHKNPGWHKLNSKNHYCDPTHWMPLPEMPKEEV